jgi:hypothetical protein
MFSKEWIKAAMILLHPDKIAGFAVEFSEEEMEICKEAARQFIEFFKKFNEVTTCKSVQKRQNILYQIEDISHDAQLLSNSLMGPMQKWYEEIEAIKAVERKKLTEQAVIIDKKLNRYSRFKDCKTFEEFKLVQSEGFAAKDAKDAKDANH